MNQTKNIFEREQKIYEAKKAELLGSSQGKFILIKESEIVGIYDTETDAINIGFEKYGSESFFVKQILDIDPIHNFFNHLAI